MYCPLCGSEAEIIGYHIHKNSKGYAIEDYSISCPKCGFVPSELADKIALRILKEEFGEEWPWPPWAGAQEASSQNSSGGE
jgi:uncharacterized Zn finger protein